MDFKDDSIIDSDTALIEDSKGNRTNGLLLTVKVGDSAVEILLEREELALALSELNEAWEITKTMGLDRSK